MTYGTKSKTLVVKNLKPSTVYYVKVRANTKAGSGIYSSFQTKITNAEPERPIATLTGCNKNIEVKEGENITCVCTSPRGNPPPVASWLTDGKVVNGPEYLRNTLFLVNVTQSDAGIYVCKVQSDSLTDEVDVNVSVKFATTDVNFAGGKPDVRVYSENNFSLSCRANGYPTPTYSFYHNGAQLTENIRDGVYSVPSAKINNTGMYRCEAQNILGRSSKSLCLFVSQQCATVDKSLAGNICSSTASYPIALAFIGGMVCTMLLLYVIWLIRHRLNKNENKKNSSKDQPSPLYENTEAEKNSIYQELDLNKSNDDGNYQSLELNTRSLRYDKEPKTKSVSGKVGYT